MLRISLFAIAALIAGVVNAQVAGDPDAAAPVVYSDAGPQAPGCYSDVRNTDGSPVISCVADTQAQDDEYADSETSAETSEYPQAYMYDEAPDYDTPAYYAPPFYLGVSVLPYDYWALGFGWPYYSYAAFGYGWPYFGSASYWGGRHSGGHHGWHDHGGWHDHHGHGDNHVPYRYAGNGRYWDQTRASNSNHGNNPGTGSRGAGAAFTASTMNRSNSMSNRTPGAVANASRFAPTGSNRVVGGAGQRAALPSASYYAAARSRMRTGTASATRSMPISRNNAANPRAADSHWVTSLPSRNYAAYARANSVYRNSSGSATRSSGYAMAPRAGYAAPPQRYAMPSRSYSPRSARSYSRGGGGHATRSGAVSSAHSSGNSHASNGATRRH